MQNVADRYLADRVATATPAMLVAMLYDAAIGRMTGAAELMDQGKRVAANHALIRAQAIVLELRLALDHEKGGEIATNLDALYVFIHRLLVKANREGDVEKVRTCVTLLSPIRDGWRDACLEQRAPVAVS
jgi:flagellar protein FliS